MANGKHPVAKFQAGQISCALWENEAKINGETRTLLKATVERRYKDASGEWKSSGSFGRSEAPIVIHLLQKAFEAMLQERSTSDPVEEEAVV
jgi:hypothetical protein